MASNLNQFNLPEQCYTVSDRSGELILLARGESGYYATKLSKETREENRALANQLNSRLEVTPQQEQAMLFGARFSWNHPAANPDFYAVAEPIMPYGPYDDQRAYSLNGGEYYLTIQICDSGYDYTIYHRNFRGWDGGQYDEPEIGMDQAVRDILEMFDLQDLSCAECDLDDLEEKIEQVDMVRYRGERSSFDLNARIDQARERSEQQVGPEPENAKDGHQI